MHVALLVTEISRQDQNFRIIPRTLPRTKLFHSECLSELPVRMHGIYCLCEQTAKVDISHYNKFKSP